MVFTIASGFDGLKSNLEITGLQTSTISTRQQAVRASIANAITVVDDFLTGSYARSTMIAPLASVQTERGLRPTFFRLVH